jgi:uncharacterized protein with von Willebrand factor type A (vWA) domain
VRYRYIRWDGTQDFDLLDAEDVMDHVADEMLEGGDLQRILQRMMRRGANMPSGQRMMGIQDLLERLRKAREQNLDRYNMGSMLDDIRERLDRVVETERRGIDRRLGRNQSDPGAESTGQGPGPRDEGADDGQPGQAGQSGRTGSSGQPGGQGQGGPLPGAADPMLRDLLEKLANRHLEQLDHLPPDVGGRIKQLRDYDFMDQDARQQFQELLDTLQKQVMQSYFKGLQQSLQSMTPEALRQIRDMVHDLNELLRQRQRGEPADFYGFMQKWGHMFPKEIQNLDQLLEYLQKQIAQMDSLLKSMTPEMRAELESMLEALFQDGEFQREMGELAQNLDRMLPGGLHPGGEHPFMGDEPITLQDAMRLMGDMNSLDELEQRLIKAAQSNDVSDVDADEIGRLLGEESRRMTQQLQELTRMLEEAGLIRRKGEGWELTPRAMHKIGQRAMQDIFGKIRESAFGDHRIEVNGVGVERLDETKAYEYGDPFLIDTQQSIMNALRREGPGMPVRMDRTDFEVYRTQTVTQASTVIMLDMSYSMMYGGRFEAGRKVALALDSLIRSQFPRDNLYVVAFSYFVLTLKPEMLLDSYWVEYGGGTNFQEALRQARQVLARHKGGTRQIILITDGEPTTYNYWGHRRRRYRPDEESFLDDDETPLGGLESTLREVARCTHDKITINTFMLDRGFTSTGFVKAMTKINRGRAFFAPPDRLGEYILVDYVNNKRKLVR